MPSTGPYSRGSRSGVSRRQVLRAAATCLTLPALPSLARETAEPPRRLVCVVNEFGFVPDQFFPQEAGRLATLPPLLAPLEGLRADFGVFSHLDHGQQGGHHSVHSFLTGVDAAEARADPELGVSLDQRVAEHLGWRTRHPCLVLGSPDGLHGGCRASWTRAGTRVLPEPSPKALFRRLFLADDERTRAAKEQHLSMRRSILDAVRDEASALRRRLNTSDRTKLDGYLESIRAVERKLAHEEQWRDCEKPRGELGEPRDAGAVHDLAVFYELVALALWTDSTRVVTLEIGGGYLPADLGIPEDYHALTHHGRLPAKLAALHKVELHQLERFAAFLERLHSLSDPEDEATLLDRTVVLFGSGMGNASSHSNADLPILVAGGGYRLGAHVQLAAEPERRVPLGNLFVSILRDFGIEDERFARASGPLHGLEAR